MDTSKSSSRNPAMLIGKNVLVIAIFWIIAFLLARLVPPARVPGTLCDLAAAIIAAVIALKIGARPAAYFLGAVISVMAAESIIVLYYGRMALNGAPTHFAVLGAGIIGVALGAFLVARYPLSTPART